MMLFPLEPEVAIVARVSVTADNVHDVFGHWRKYHPQACPRPVSTSPEWKKIVARFNEGYTVAQLCRAIDGIHKSSFHCGENAEGRKWLTILICFRDASQVEKFIELANQPAGPVLSEKTQRTVRALSQWAQREDDK